MFDELKQMNAELEQLKAAHLEKSKGIFTNVAAQLFTKHPALQSFGWTQYTPYYNDGDECVFSARTDDPDINGIDSYSMDFEDELITDYDSSKKDGNGNYSKKPNEWYGHPIKGAVEDVKEFLSNIDNAVLRDMFGDHVQVKVTANGTEVEEYEHD